MMVSRWPLSLAWLANAALVSDQVRGLVRRLGWLLVADCLLAGLIFVQVVLVRLSPAELSLYIFQPLMWLTLAVLGVCLWLAEGEPLRLLEQRGLILLAALIGALQVVVAVLLGLVIGFGRSPYAHTFDLLTLNLWFVGTRLLGVEVIRWYLGRSVGRIHPSLGLVVAWLVPLLCLIPFGQYGLLATPETALRVTGQTFLPAAAENFLAACLAISAGPLASLAYRGVLQAFEWLSPILPDLPWIGVAFVGVLVPVLGVLLLHHQEVGAVEAQAREVGTARQEAENAPANSWLVVAALAVAVIWLNNGFLGIRPSLVSGNSMNPSLYPGDVVITRAISPDDILVGDVIRFRRGGLDVVHRVVRIEANGAAPVFTTRGDNNNVNDEPVTADRIEGKVILTLPKIGWVGIAFRRSLAWIGGLL